ncbi:serine/threonine-protein kinase [Rubritalea sp.]|uniref:serine/threonine-protein kinase n=1 Tax=Rubritalea sp. TaxID=2109375 RepID=UPI003EF53A12
MTPDPTHQSSYYQPDKRLKQIYQQVDNLDEEVLEALCPSFNELVSIEERYTNLHLIGKGALKEVYRCHDEMTQRFVALALPRAEHGPEFFDEFIHESWLVSSLNHPNIINVHDAGTFAEGRPFFTMDLKGNSTLADAVERTTSHQILLEIFLKICDALAYAHAQGVIHRDIKPENIQCDSYGQVLVCDWGLGKFVHQRGSDHTHGATKLFEARHVTSIGQIKGTLGYMAPEQIQGSANCDQRSDIFSLGCLLHFMLTGVAPFTGTEQEILKQTMVLGRKSPRKEFPQKNIPKALDAIILKTISYNPADRYQSVTELKSDIYLHLLGHSTGAERPNIFRRALLFTKRNKAPVSIAASALAVIGLCTLWYLQSLDKKEQETFQAREHSLQLSSEVDELTAEYEALFNQTEEPRRKQAKQLLLQAMDKKRKSVFTKPVVPFRNVNELIDRSLTLDPDSKEAQFQHFSIHCIMLDFKNALKHPVELDHQRAGYMDYVKAFPEFNFSETKRPSVEQLAHFIREARNIDDKHGPLMLAILAYDHEARTDKTHYAGVIGAALEFLSQKSHKLSTSYLPKSDQLTISSEKEFTTSNLGKLPTAHILRYLQVDGLVLKIDDSFHLNHLDNTSIKRLDLSHCSDPVMNKQIMIRKLEEIIINNSQKNVKWRQRILTSSSLDEIKITVREPSAKL